MTVEVFSKSGCVACRQSMKTLDRLGVPYAHKNIEEDEAAYNKVKSLGFMQAPVIIVTDEAGRVVNSFSGYQPEKLEALV